MCALGSQCAPGLTQVGRECQACFEVIGLNVVLAEGAEPTPLQSECGKDSNTAQLLVFTTSVLYPEQRIVLEMVYLLLVSFQ